MIATGPDFATFSISQSVAMDAAMAKHKSKQEKRWIRKEAKGSQCASARRRRVPPGSDHSNDVKEECIERDEEN